MPSTTLFAPSVRAIQPAFVYSSSDINSGKVKIYFSLSSYNKVSEITHIFYTIVDPNQVSSWGNNSMLQSGKIASVAFDSQTYNLGTEEYYITLDLFAKDSDNASIFKTFTKNQYYQVQIAVGTSSTYNEDSCSLFSQATLIRPIPPAILTINGYSGGTAEVYDLSSLSGSLTYEGGSTAETINTCECYLGSYHSPVVVCNGLTFTIPLDYNFKENVEYEGEVKCTTVNGYEIKSVVAFKLIPFAGTITSTVAVSPDPAAAAIHLSFSSEMGAGSKIQRTSDESEYSVWKTIHTLTVEEKSKWSDYMIEGGVSYKYRVVNQSGNNSTPASNAATVYFEDILLSNKDMLCAIRYNPNITNFKYVAQEAITNSLGGKYPIIRKNGDTHYRQFNLSGSIYVNCVSYNLPSTVTNLSSNGKNMSTFFTSADNESSLYLTSAVSISGSNKEVLEKRARQVIMSFLTDGSVKLFRSFEEGNMIVYLSAVSFTPNKQLGRHIYDFSATVTEVCDCTADNLKKYGLNRGGYTQFTSSIAFDASSQGSVTDWPNA